MMQSRVYELNKAAATLAKRATAEVTKNDPDKPRFVAGVVGPTSYKLSVGHGSAGSVSKHASQRKHSSYVGHSHGAECKQYGSTSDRFGHVATEGPLKGKYFCSRAWREWQMWPSARWPDDGVFEDVTFDEMLEVYLEQICGLMDGGADMLIFEAVADTLNAKAAIYALEIYFEQFRSDRVPLIISASLSPSSGRMDAGQSIEAFFISVNHAKPFAVGIDGSCDALEIKGFYKTLTQLCSTYCHVCPSLGSSSRSESTFAANLVDLGDLHFVGGGSGTLPSHIAELTQKVVDVFPRKLPRKDPCLMLAGLDPFFINSQAGAQLVGQRCNLLGGKQFRQLVYDCKFHSALDICVEQIDNGADLLDINFDTNWKEFDSLSAMTTFLSFHAAEPKVAKAPVMVGSHLWPVIEAGLKQVQGKSIISAIGLTLIEDKFLLAAQKARRLGAALVIRAMDQDSQGESYEDKVRICQKCYQLLRSKLDFPPEDIIFDCVLQPLGFKGLKSTRAIDFINAVETIKRSCPHVSFIVGLSNLSVAFRFSPELRNAMHSVFLQHAIPKGLNFAMVDSGSLPKYSELEPRLLRACEEVILNEAGDDEAVERFQALAGMMAGVDVQSQLAELDAPSSGQQIMVPSLPETYPMPESVAIQPLTTIVQSAGALGGGVFAAFGTKSGATWHIHRTMVASEVSRNVAFSSISAWMGQGGSGVVTAGSCLLDSYVLWSRWQQLDNKATTVQWGPIGDIGLRRVIYGSRDVFAQYDIGQKLISAEDSAAIERAILIGASAPDFLSIAYVTETTQSIWEGKVTVKLRDQQAVMSFKIRKTTPLSKLIDAYLKQKNVRGVSAQLAHKGRALDENETIESLGLNDGDTIDAIEY